MANNLIIVGKHFDHNVFFDGTEYFFFSFGQNKLVISREQVMCNNEGRINELKKQIKKYEDYQLILKET